MSFPSRNKHVQTMFEANIQSQGQGLRSGAKIPVMLSSTHNFLYGSAGFAFFACISFISV